MAPVEDAWEHESVLLPTDFAVLSEELRQTLTVKRALRVGNELVTNPLAYYACEGAPFNFTTLAVHNMRRIICTQTMMRKSMHFDDSTVLKKKIIVQ